MLEWLWAWPRNWSKRLTWLRVLCQHGLRITYRWSSPLYRCPCGSGTVSLEPEVPIQVAIPVAQAIANRLGHSITIAHPEVLDHYSRYFPAIGDRACLTCGQVRGLFGHRKGSIDEAVARDSSVRLSA